MYKPNGQIQPQKNRPKKMVTKTIAPKTTEGHSARRGNVKKTVITDAA
jgi:hypothetical protein